MIFLLIVWLGLVVGSFLNVCIYRIQRDESIVEPPRSHCPRCRHVLAWHDNIPVLSYLWLGGRCRYCRKPISLRYPWVEIISAAILAGLWFRWPQGAWWFAAYAASAVLVVIAFIDWETFLIPDILSLGLLAAGIAAAPINPFFPGALLARVGYSVLGGMGGFLICWAVAAFGEMVFKKEAMGGGDIKLLAAVGAWTGVLGAFDCIMVGSFLGAAYGVPLLLKGQLRRQDPIPFGPFLSIAAIFNFFYLIPFGFPFL